MGTVAETLGTPLMPWQQQVIDVGLEIDPATGLLAYETVILTVPRQQGKTALMLALWVFRAVGFDRQRISWTMQSAKEAKEKWIDDHVPLILASPLGRAVSSVRKQNGSEAVIFHNGSIQTLMASTKSAGHGQVLDLGIVDEAWVQTDDRMEQSMGPAMLTRPEPQMWIVSTAGDAGSTWFKSKIEAGRAVINAGLPSRTAFFEWSADESADPADPATWRSCMPALGLTVRESAIATRWQRAVEEEEEAGFRRAYLNQWTVQRADPVISATKWQAVVDHESTAAAPLVFSWEVTPMRDFASICVAAHRGDGLEHGELIDHRPGLAWVPARMGDLVERHRPAAVVVDPLGPGGSLTEDVRREFMRRNLTIEVIEVTSHDYAASCGQLFDSVCGERPTLRHRGQEALAVAVDGAAKRQIGDTWVWSRRTSMVDISPLVALTLARWGLVSRPGAMVDLGGQVW